MTGTTLPIGFAAPMVGQTATESARATGGSPTLVALVFVALFVATILSLYLAIRLYRGYRQGGGTPMLVLGVGLVLLTTVPMVLRFVLSNAPGVGPTVQELLATACQLLGLLMIMGVLYARD